MAVERRRFRPRRSRGGLGVFLLASLVPLGAAGWFLAQPAERREELLARIPPGAGGRALAAGAAFGLLILLAAVALPAFHRASASIRRLRGRILALPGPVRVVLLPFQLLLWLGWFLLQLVFAVDAFLIVAAGLLGLLMVIRIVHPGFLPDLLPALAG